MADVERERVTALWREAAAAVEVLESPLPDVRAWIDSPECGETSRAHITRLLAECWRLRERVQALQVDADTFADAAKWHAEHAGRLREQLDAARREVDSQMQSKLDAQVTLRAVTEALDLRFDELGNGWREAAPKILARIETIVDEADRAFHERDVARAALGVEGEQE